MAESTIKELSPDGGRPARPRRRDLAVKIEGSLKQNGGHSLMSKSLNFNP